MLYTQGAPIAPAHVLPQGRSVNADVTIEDCPFGLRSEHPESTQNTAIYRAPSISSTALCVVSIIWTGMVSNRDPFQHQHAMHEPYEWQPHTF